MLKNLYFEGVRAVDPEKLVRKNIGIFWDFFNKQKRKKIIIISIGKASLGMAEGAIKELGKYFYKGIIITNFRDKNSIFFSKYNPSSLKIFKGGHPLPDKKSLKGTKEILNLIENEKDACLFFVLISGGGSSLLVAPKEGITLKEKITATQLLLKAGASIEEINCLRKHLSKVKGGNLAKLIYPAPLISFIISDVISDKLNVIASAPTYPDRKNFKDALKIIRKYKIENKMPEGVLKVLKDGIEGKIEENPKYKNKIFNNVKNFIIGNNEIALKEIKKKAEELGFKSKIFSRKLKGEAREIGKNLAKLAIKEKEKKFHKKPLILIFGGEPTVKVRGKGKGGRAQEVALSFSIYIKGKKGIYLLAAGSDGKDGPTNSAGAIVDGKTIIKGEKMGLNPKFFLENNDSYNFFKRTNSLFITGPTGTNVMDFYIILIK